VASKSGNAVLLYIAQEVSVIRAVGLLALMMLAACAATPPQATPAADQADLQSRLDQEAKANSERAASAWVTQLVAAIVQNWAWPPGTDPAWRVWAKFKINPAGAVLSAEIVHGSGHAVFDDSVIRAIYKASPLPLPSDPSVFDPNIVVCFARNPRSCQEG
jgi:colicin import membrane protein